MEDNKIQQVEHFKFEPIKGYPMLHWKGKRPFESTFYYPAQLKEVHGKPDETGWMNKIFWGDNLQVMSHLLKEFRGRINLIYIDPPFDSKADYKKKIELRGKEVSSDHTLFEEKQYTDIWTNDEYLQFMYERLILMRELLSESGLLFLHCDHRKVFHLKCILDEIFGESNFRNMISWRRQIPRGRKAEAKYLPFSADYILMYSKGNNPKWNLVKKEVFISLEEAEKKYQKDEKGYFRTSDPGSYTNESLVKLFKEGRIYVSNRGEAFIDKNGILKTTKGKIGIKYYREQVGDKVREEKIIDNIWEDIAGMGVVSSEYVNYPTQKPEALLERIIEFSTDQGDLVFDCFMGSGTTQKVAMKMNRRFIGADINKGAIDTTTKRLLDVINESNNRYVGFEVYNVNNYEFFRNPVQAKELLMEALEIQPLPGNSLYDGELDGRMVKIMPINRIATKADLGELIQNFDYKLFEKRRGERPNQPVEKLLLVCMGHEPDLKSFLQKQVPYKLDVEIVDILRDRQDLQFKREAEADIVIENGKLIIKSFYPMNLLQKLSLMQESVEDWRELVDSIMIDWNYDGSVLEPSVIDVPDKNELVKGIYDVPENARTIKVKITDLLSESLEVEIENV